MRPRVSVLITDIDNTLFDWVEIWFKPFDAMLEKLVSSSGVNRQQLIQEIKQVHQNHGTSEYAFLIEELPSLVTKYPDGNLVDKFDDVIHTYRTERKKALKLYASVLDTLKVLRERGVLIVGYTESMAFYSNYRIRNLGLDGVIDYLYSPKDHDLPKNLTQNQIRRNPSQSYDLKFTQHRHTPAGELKPNPKLLLDIISEIGAIPQQCLYVGDNLMKDISMAQKAGVYDAYALYGKAQNRPAYELLRQVSHWSQNQIETERNILENVLVNPTYTLEVSFSEILAKFDFSPFYSSTSPDLAMLVDIWKKVIDVQQHFNEIEMKVRNVAVTVVGVFIGASGIAYKKDAFVSLFSWKTKIPLSSCILWLAIIPLGAFYLMDRWWYHRLLHGATKHGEKIEDRIRPMISEIDLTKTIADGSPFKILGFQIRTNHKIDIIYALISSIIILLGFALNHDNPK